MAPRRKPHRGAPRNARNGFTLIELVTCIVILGVLVAVTGPRFLSYQPFQERGYIDEVAASMRYAQRVAVASACDVQFTVGVASYTAKQRSAAGGTCSAAGAWSTAVSRGDSTPLSGAAPAGVTMSPATQMIFSPQGAVSSGPPPALSVGAFTLSVDAGSGLVVVQ